MKAEDQDLCSGCFKTLAQQLLTMLFVLSDQCGKATSTVSSFISFQVESGSDGNNTGFLLRWEAADTDATW